MCKIEPAASNLGVRRATMVLYESHLIVSVYLFITKALKCGLITHTHTHIPIHKHTHTHIFANQMVKELNTHRR